jgi:hypothetical protein
VVKAVGCDSTIRRFKSGHSPYFKHLKIKSKKNQVYNIIAILVLCRVIEDQNYVLQED